MGLSLRVLDVTMTAGRKTYDSIDMMNREVACASVPRVGNSCR